MMRRRSRHLEPLEDEENLLGLSGWVYSDLLLGIAVVFLAAVSFQAVIPVSADQDAVQEQSEGVVEEPADVRECIVGISVQHIEVLVGQSLRGAALAETVERQIREELATFEEIDAETATFGLILAFGGAEDANVGAGRANGVVSDLLVHLPDRFVQVASRSLWGGRRAELAGNVRLDLFPYSTEPCDAD